ncbi:MAG: DoxX family protein [Bacteroidales bacterium]|nr:DoxX family protein [Bacteroidales bacterium]MDT8432320.1 DoxX family protein [Bacteroidales bacterium]
MKNFAADWKKLAITLVRAAIGWHFLYEGFSKLFMENWSAQGYLANAYGFLSGFYHWMAESDALLTFIDFINVWGIILIGTALFIGAFTRISAAGGILFLLLYYFAYPPFGTSLFGSPEGHFYIINRNLIEALVLTWFVIGNRPGWSVDALWKQRKRAGEGAGFVAPGAAGTESTAGDTGRANAAETTGTSSGDAAGSATGVSAGAPSRREALKNLATLPFLGALGWGAFRRTGNEVDVLSGATIQLNFSSLSELKGPLPKGRIMDQVLSKLILGGNLVGGWAHSRDLRYVPSLFRAYNTEKKIYETLMLAEQAGINAINISFPTKDLMAKYKKSTGSKIKVITQVAPDMDNNDIYVNINKAIDTGVDIIQVQGNWCDWLVRDGKLEVIDKMLDHIRSEGYVAGLGSHTVDSLIVCEENGIIPDYYMKTMHHDNYWSAHPRENRVPFEVDGERSMDHNKFHDNCFCLFPDKTTEFVNNTTVPVMGFKVLAAGAIEPRDGFDWAFRNGADFICVGMFDFQLVDDVNITIDVLNNLQGRTREWYG